MVLQKHRSRRLWELNVNAQRTSFAPPSSLLPYRKSAIVSQVDLGKRLFGLPMAESALFGKDGGLVSEGFTTTWARTCPRKDRHAGGEGRLGSGFPVRI